MIAQIEDSLNNIMTRSKLFSDHLCCGNASLGEVLLTAGQRYQNPVWEKAALRLTSEIVFRRSFKSVFKPRFAFDFFNPSLFQGTSGFGYHLLRLAEPKNVPSILLF